MGPRYILDHCIEAYRQEQEEKQFRAYITDGIMAATENTAMFAGGKYLQMRWADMVDTNDEPEDDRDGLTIATEFLEHAGITVID